MMPADVEGYTVRQGHPTLSQCYGIRVLSGVNNTMTRPRLQGSGMLCFVTVRRSMTRPPVHVVHGWPLSLLLDSDARR